MTRAGPLRLCRAHWTPSSSIICSNASIATRVDSSSSPTIRKSSTKTKICTPLPTSRPLNF